MRAEGNLRRQKGEAIPCVNEPQRNSLLTSLVVFFDLCWILQFAIQFLIENRL